MADERPIDLYEWVGQVAEMKLEQLVEENPRWDWDGAGRRLSWLLVPPTPQHTKLGRAQDRLARAADGVVGSWLGGLPEEEREELEETVRFEDREAIAYNAWAHEEGYGVGFWEELDEEQWEDLEGRLDRSKSLSKTAKRLNEVLDEVVYYALTGGVAELEGGVLLLNPLDFVVGTPLQSLSFTDANENKQRWLAWGTPEQAANMVIERYNDPEIPELSADWDGTGGTWGDPIPVDHPLYGDAAVASLSFQEDLSDTLGGYTAWAGDLNTSLIQAAKDLGLATYGPAWKPDGLVYVVFGPDQIEAFLVWQDMLLQAGHVGLSRIVPRGGKHWPGDLGVKTSGYYKEILTTVVKNPRKLKSRLLR